MDLAAHAHAVSRRHRAPAAGRHRDARWSRTSWRAKELLQQAAYADPALLERTASELAALPGVVGWREVESLRQRLAEVALGQRLVIQGGDCAERFERCLARPIARTSAVLGRMAEIIGAAFARPVTTIARLAGQYAKPRSAAIETRAGLALPSYRGDLVNAPAFSAEAREPRPERLLEAHRRAAASLAIARRATAGWAEPLYVSHESLHLHYEAALTRHLADVGRSYALSTHLPWIGMRTAHPDAAQVELLRGVANPIAMKVGPAMDPDRLCRLADLLDPDRLPGRLTLIHRFGHDRVSACLPPLVDAMRATGHPVVWLCDAVHGNTVTTASGRKTRRFEHIWSEIERAFTIHDALGSHLGGLHLELTGDAVTECTGGAGAITDDDLERRYESAVDPRLNRHQAVEMAQRVAALAPTLVGHRPNGELLSFPKKAAGF